MLDMYFSTRISLTIIQNFLIQPFTLRKIYYFLLLIDVTTPDTSVQNQVIYLCFVLSLNFFSFDNKEFLIKNKHMGNTGKTLNIYVTDEVILVLSVYFLKKSISIRTG